MDANNLKYFIAVARCGSINRAAKAMYISQPQLSHIIKNIEYETGLTLFRRSRQGVLLTAEGKKFLEHCSVIEQEMDNLRHFVNRASQSADRRLFVSMTRFSHTSECFQTVCRSHQDDPSFNCKLNETSFIGVIDDVASCISDIGVLHFSSENQGILTQSFSEKKLNFQLLASFRPQICLSENHPLIAAGHRDGISIEMLKDYGFIRYIDQYDDFLYRIHSDNGVMNLNESAKIIYLTDRQGQMRLLSSTDFFTIGISAFNNQDRLYGVISVPIQNCSERLRFGYIFRQDTTLTHMEEEFICALKERYAALKEQDPSC